MMWSGALHAEEDYIALNEQAAKLVSEKHYTEALEVAFKALTSAQQKFGANSETTDKIALNYATILKIVGRDKDAAAEFEKARDHYIARYGPRDARLAPIYFEIGKALSLSSGNDASQALRHAIDLYEHEAGTNDPNYVRALFQLGYAKAWVGDFDRASPDYRKALRVSKKIFGEAALITGEAHNAMGQYDFMIGDYRNAEREYRHAIAIFDAKLPPTDSRALAARGALVPVYKKLGRTDEAMEQTMELAMLAPDAEGGGVALYLGAPDFGFYGTKDFYEGPIDVKFTITAEGKVDHIEFFGQRSNKANEDAVRKALSQWIYKPRVVNGKPVESTAQIRFVVKKPD